MSSPDGPPGGCGRQILLVEDDVLLGALLTEILTRDGYQVELARDTVEGLQRAHEMDPDLVMTDVMLGPGPTGLDLAYNLQQRMPWVALVLITSVTNLDAAGLGAAPPGVTVIQKSQLRQMETLLEAIDASLRGELVVIRGNTPTRPFPTLTKSQVAALRMVAQGLSNEAIAQRRNCSKSAVEKLLSSAYRSLGIEPSSELNERAEAARLFVQEIGHLPRRDD